MSRFLPPSRGCYCARGGAIFTTTMKWRCLLRSYPACMGQGMITYDHVRIGITGRIDTMSRPAVFDREVNVFLGRDRCAHTDRVIAMREVSAKS